MSSLICSHCAIENRDTAQFCNGCGARLTLGATTIALASPQTAPAACPIQARQVGVTAGEVLQRRYHITRRLGAGGMGAVYLARDQRLRRDVAIKELQIDAQTPDERQEIVEAFEHEALLLASLVHPNLPRVTDHFEEMGHWYLVMDYIEGETLEEYAARRGGRLDLETALFLGITLCEVLLYLHSRTPPIIFRDLKPENVLFTPAGQLFLVDFGIARTFKPGQAKDTRAYGTIGYAPPEQFNRQQTDARSDLYALGALLHRLLTGRDPSAAPFQFDVTDIWPQAVRTLLVQLLNRDPNQRPGSAHEVAIRLRELQGEATPLNAAVAATQSARSSGPASTTSVQQSRAPGRSILFICSQRASDQAIMRELEVHLALLRRKYRLAMLHNATECLPGDNTERYWEKIVRQAGAILVLCSPDLFAHELIDRVEHMILPTVREHGIPLFPILVRPIAGGFSGPLQRFLMLPRDGRALASCKDRDEAMAAIAAEIRIPFAKGFPEDAPESGGR